MAHNSALMLNEYMHGTVSRWLWMNRAYVGIGACLNLNVSLWHDHNYTLGRYSNTPLQRRWHITHGYVLILMLTEYIYLLRIYRTLSRCLWTNRSYVGIAWCIFWIQIFHCLLYGAPWHDRNYTLGRYSNTPQRRWHMTHGFVPVLILTESILHIYQTVLRWLWMNSGYVGIGASLNINVSLLGVRCTMTRL